jgi:hypothetical protein
VVLKGDCSICVNLGKLSPKGASICLKCSGGSLWEVPFMELPVEVADTVKRSSRKVVVEKRSHHKGK